MRGLLRFLVSLAVVMVGVRAVAKRSRHSRPAQETRVMPAVSPSSPSHTDEPASRDVASKRSWTLRILMLAALLIVLAFGGFLVAASGIIPIKASSGHWPITAWFLHFSMKRSIATHTIGVKAPPLDDPGLVLKGAGHYDYGCMPCHGSPTLPHPRIPAAMTPHPPYLPPRMPDWEDEELFYIVKHGVKFTGMPAWPSLERDDEVWAIVAFLRKLPEMDAAEYQRLVGGESMSTAEASPLDELAGPEAEAARKIIQDRCESCHGVAGEGRGTGAFPKLAGQRPLYLLASLKAYARGERHSGIMEPLAPGLSDEVLQTIADYYGGLNPGEGPKTAEPDPEAVARGRAIAEEGDPKRRVPACAECHGPNKTETNPTYPKLAGQYADYLRLQLELFKSEHRGGTEYAHIMQSIAARLNTEQMRDLAAYYASLAAREEVSE